MTRPQKIPNYPTQTINGPFWSNSLKADTERNSGLICSYQIGSPTDKFFAVLKNVTSLSATSIGACAYEHSGAISKYRPTFANSIGGMGDPFRSLTTSVPAYCSSSTDVPFTWFIGIDRYTALYALSDATTDPKSAPVRREISDASLASEWMNRYFDNHPEINPSELLALRRAVIEFFPGAGAAFDLVTDPEEGWTRLVMKVSTVVDSFEARLEQEENFYNRVDSSQELRRAMSYVIVSFS